MIYKPNETFRCDGAILKCVLDKKGTTCDDCVFGIDGGSCTEREYNRHPCYHTDRGDEHNVHFVLP